MFGNLFDRKPVTRLEEYHPVWSDDSYENAIAEEDRIDRAWGEDEDDSDDCKDDANPFDHVHRYQRSSCHIL